MLRKGSSKTSKKEVSSQDNVSALEEEIPGSGFVYLQPSLTSLPSTSSYHVKSAESIVLNVFSNPKYEKKYDVVESDSQDSRAMVEDINKRNDSPFASGISEEEVYLPQAGSLTLGPNSDPEKKWSSSFKSDLNLRRKVSKDRQKKKKEFITNMSPSSSRQYEKTVDLSGVSKSVIIDPNKWPKDYKLHETKKSSSSSSSSGIKTSLPNSDKKKSLSRLKNVLAYFEGNEKDREGKDPNKKTFTEINVSDTELAEVKSDVLLESDVSPEKDKEIKTYYQQLYFYVIFLTIVTGVALNMVSSNMYYLTNLLKVLYFDTPNIRQGLLNQGYLDIGRTLRESRTYNDFWVFVESTMIEMFYWEYFYSDKDPVIHTSNDDRKMVYENQLLGVPRLRQVRVRNDSCKIYPSVKRFFNTCYDYYNVYDEETRPLEYNMQNSITPTAWVYTEAEVLNTSYYYGDVSVYGGGGYYLDLSLEKNTAMAQVQELKSHLWVYRGTRAVFIDFTVYNSNANLFCICKIVIEFPPVGGMLPFADFHTLKLIRYISVKDFFILGCEIILVLFTVYYTYSTILLMRYMQSLFFFNIWNYFDLFILALLYIQIPLNVHLFIKNSEIIRELPDRIEMYTEFEQAKDRQITFNTVVAILTFCCWIKLFKFLNFSVNLLEYKRTLLRSLKDILGFIPIFLTIFVAFAILANLLFCDQVKNYRTVWLSFLALLQAFLGEFQYKPIEEANRILGPIFYLLFVFFIFFVLLNVFIAIINDAYSTVKSEVIVDKPLTGKYFKRAFLNISKCLCCNLGKKMQSKTSDKKLLIMNELEETLKRAGFTEDEIKLFFAKYSIDVNSMLDAGTKRKIIEELELNRTEISERTHEVQIFSINRRIDGKHKFHKDPQSWGSYPRESVFLHRKTASTSNLHAHNRQHTGNITSIAVSPAITAAGIFSGCLRLDEFETMDGLNERIKEIEINLQPIIDKLDILIKSMNK